MDVVNDAKVCGIINHYVLKYKPSIGGKFVPMIMVGILRKMVVAK